MNLLFRNFWNTLRRYKVASILNILGLSVAFAAFAIIMMQVNYDLSYNKFHEKYDRIYRLEMQNEDRLDASFPRPFLDKIQRTVPGAEVLAIFHAAGGHYIKTDLSSQEYPFFEQVTYVTPEVLLTFDFDIVQGDASLFNRPDKVIISESQASAFFGNNEAVGRHLQMLGVDSVQHEIVAVYKDFPRNSTLKNEIYQMIGERLMDEPWNWACSAYVLLDSQESRDAMVRELDAMGRDEWNVKVVPQPPTRLTSLNDIHFDKEITWDLVEKSNRSTVYTLLLIGILVIVIAVINFINFSTALIPVRIKSINTRKVLGASLAEMRREMVFEAVGTSVIAGCIALWMIYMVSVSSFSSMIDADMAFRNNGTILLGMGLVALLTGLVAGIYPAFYSTSFEPALVLKGSFGLSPKGRKLRTLLISIQYVISIVLIICAVFIRVQNDYVKNFPIGMSKEDVLTVSITEEVYRKSDVLVNELKKNPQVVEVAFSDGIVVSQNKSNWGNIQYKGEYVHFYVMCVTEEYLSTLGIQLTEGRDFIPEDRQRTGTFIFNEAARKEFGFELGTEVDVHGYRKVPIVGITHDFNFKPLHYGVEPMALLLEEDGDIYFDWTAYIRVNTTDLPATIAHIRETVAGMGSIGKDLVEVEFLDKSLDRLYKNDTNLSNLITLFSLLAIMISLIGVFGLVLFESQYRRKEIGVRRINGATITEILRMLNTGFIKIVLICFVIAAPIAYFASTKWLEAFAYKSQIYWWIFGVALLVVLLITLLTVTLQSYRAATENPVNSIKTE